MGVESYLFALFVFVLVVMVVFMVMKGTKKNRSLNEKIHEEREKKIMTLYFEVEDMLDELKKFVTASEQKMELQAKKMEVDLRAMHVEKTEQRVAQTEEEIWKIKQIVDVKKKEEPILLKKEEVQIIKSNSMNEDVFKMYQDGINIKTIAEKLNIAQGEVIFILKLGGVHMQKRDAS